MIFAQCHTNRNYGGLQILSVVCYMLYQTDLVISFNRIALKVNLKKHSSHSGGGGGGGRICINFIKCIPADLYDINSK